MLISDRAQPEEFGGHLVLDQSPDYSKTIFSNHKFITIINMLIGLLWGSNKKKSKVLYKLKGTVQNLDASEPFGKAMRSINPVENIGSNRTINPIETNYSFYSYNSNSITIVIVYSNSYGYHNLFLYFHKNDIESQG